MNSRAQTTARADIALRVRRILSGQRNERDLERLFQWLRARSLGHGYVEDIGHFVAHLETRDRGESLKIVHNLVAVMEYHWPRFGGKVVARPPPGKDKLAKVTRAALDLQPERSVRTLFGMPKTKARKALNTALGKIDIFDGAFIGYNRPLTDLEKRLVTNLSTMIPVWALTPEILMEDLAPCLLKNHLIAKSELTQLEAQRDWISLFVVEKMHLAELRLESGEVVTLQGGWHPDRKMHLEVKVNLEIPAKEGRKTTHVLPVFHTELPAPSVCEPELLRSYMWAQPVEINSAGKLQLVRESF